MKQQQRRPSPRPRLWKGGRFHHDDTDPLTGFANIMDVMLVFALGLLIALISQNDQLKHHFSLTKVEVTTSQELTELPENMQGKGDERQGMENIGTVYRDAKTGKLILIGQ